MVLREGEAGFNKPAELSLGYCPACRRNKPGQYNKIANEFLCMKCGYPIGEPVYFKISKKLKYESWY